MIVPKTIVMQLKCDTDGNLADLIVQMSVHSGIEYRIYFPKTDGAGRAELSATDFSEQFREQMEFSIMDHAGPIASADQHAKLALYDPALMRQRLKFILLSPLSDYERAIWPSRRAMVDYFLSCRNDLFELARRPRFVEMPQDGFLHLKVRAKRAQ